MQLFSHTTRSNKTVAWPLSLLYLAVVVYASWYPFGPWQSSGLSPLAFMIEPMPKYWTWFDVIINVLGYAPLGFLFCLSALRMRQGRAGVLVSVLVCAAVSLCMEFGQNFLPSRIASNADAILNILGGSMGVLAAWLLERLGAISRWHYFRQRWFVPGSHGALVLLLLWPVALLFPAPLAFGLGQVYTRLRHQLLLWFANPDGSASQVSQWLGGENPPIHPLSSLSETFCIFVGFIAPALLGMAIISTPTRRIILLPLAWFAGFWVMTLSTALSYGPLYAWAWLRPESWLGLVLAGLVSLLCSRVSQRILLTLLLLLLPLMLVLLNQAPITPFFAETLGSWEAGRFIRFNGLLQWLGWLWPYATILWVMGALISHDVQRSAVQSFYD